MNTIQNASTRLESTPVETGKRIKVCFELLSCLAHEIHLAGDFNGWDPQALPLENDGGSRWSVEIALQPGTYEYLFVVDGTWETDPCARSVKNCYGTFNSVIRVPEDIETYSNARKTARKAFRNETRRSRPAR